MNKFKGFESSKQNWSKLPHQLIEALPNIKTIGEMKVIIYTLRHTWGYQDNYKKITLDEFENGRKRKDGSRIDNGTGLTKPTIVDGIKRAIADGFLFEHVDSSDTARVKKFYSLTQEGLKDLTPGVKTFNTRGKDSLHRTEKETIKKETSENGSAKNSQNQNGEDGFDRADQAERDNLNFIANQLARVTKIRVATADEPTIERLKKTALLGYQLAEYCQISLSKLKPREINGHFRYSKALENFLGDIITLAADGVTPADLKANKDWWYNKYWLGRDKHQPPTSAQVCAMWGQFEAAQSALASATAGLQLSDVAKENYKRLLAEQAK
jgi:DNA-binding PadR family transcriptional regulator